MTSTIEIVDLEPNSTTTLSAYMPTLHLLILQANPQTHFHSIIFGDCRALVYKKGINTFKRVISLGCYVFRHSEITKFCSIIASQLSRNTLIRLKISGERLVFLIVTHYFFKPL